VYRDLGRLRSNPGNYHDDPTFANEQRTLPDVWVARCGREIDALRTCLFHARATQRLMSFSLYTREELDRQAYKSRRRCCASKACGPPRVLDCARDIEEEVDM
jgi:hypothetical protein